MTPQHEDDWSQEWPIRETDLSKSFEKLKDYMRQEESLMKEVKEIINPPNPLQPPHSTKQ